MGKRGGEGVAEGTANEEESERDSGWPRRGGGAGRQRRW